MNKLIFLYSFLFLLSGCFLDQEGKDQSSVEVKISENLVTGAAGGAILYLVNKDLNIQRSIILANNNLNLQLRQGTWDFAIVTWIGDGSANPVFKGSSRCGLQRGVRLASSSESVSLTFAASTCTDSFFTPSTHVVGGATLKPLKLVNCLDASNPVSGTYCDGSFKGAAQSYKIKLLTKSSPTPKTAMGFLGAMNSYVTNPGGSGVSSLDSDCIVAATGTNSVNSTGLYFPFSSPHLFIPASIEAYSDSSCTTGKQSYIFPSGLGAIGGNASILTSSVAKTTSTTTSSDLYVAYLSAQLTGNNFFGKVFLSDNTGVTNTFTITNNTSSTVTLGAPQFTSPSNTEFSLSSSLCSSTLGPSLSCTIDVKFLPSNLKGLVSGSLSITVNGVSQSKTLTAFVIPDKFKTFPQGGWASGGNYLPSNKINDVYIEPDSGKKFVGTDGGLAIQTGAFGWTIITTKEGLSSNIINTVYAYKVGANVHVYAGTPSGLSFSSNGGATFTTLMSNSFINDVFAETLNVGGSNQTRVYVGTNDSLKVSADGGVNFTSLSVASGVHKILVDSSTIYFSNNSSFLSSTSLTVSGGGAVALSMSLLINFEYQSLTGSIITTSNAKVSDIIKDGVNIYALVSTSAGVSTALDGLYLLNTNFEHKISIPHLAGTATKDFTGMVVDNNGELFITQKNGGGLYKVTPPASPIGTFTSANISVSLFSTSLNAISIFSDISGTKFLLGTSSEVLYAQHTGATSPTTLSWGPSNTGAIGSLAGGGLPNNWVNAFGFWGSTGNYLVGTKEGLAVTQNNWSSRYIWLPTEEITAMTIKGTDVYYTSKVSSVTKVYSSPLSTINTAPNPLNSSLSGPINDIFVTNTTLYLASSSVGVYYRNISGGLSWPAYQASPIGPLLSNNVRNVWVDNSGNIYLTYGDDDYNPSNINCYSCQVGKITPSPTPTANQLAGISVVPGNIKKFYVDPTGQVFVTTDNGLIRKWASLSDLDSNVTPTNISIGSFSPAPSINDIVVKNVAGSNNIYVATSRGLFISLDNGTTWTEKNAATHGLPTNNVKKIQVDAQNDVYISTTGAEGAASGGGFAKTY